MKVAIVTPVYPPYRAGMSVLPAQEADMLRAAGHEVVVATPAYGPGEAGRQGDVVRMKPLLTIGNAAILGGLPLVLHGATVIHLHYPFFGTDILTVMAAKALRRPYIVTYHMKAVAPGVKGWIFRLYRLCFERFVLRRAYRVLVSTEEYARANRVPRADVVAIPFGVDTEKFTPGNQQEARQKLGLVQNVPWVAFVGAMDEQHAFKGVGHLLQALVQVPNLHALLVGDGTLRTEYEAVARRLGVADRVRFLGRLQEEKKILALQAADWHVLPSTSRSEAFGIVTLEAMACGKPSVVSDLPGVRTLVHDGDTGRTVTPGDSASLAATFRALMEQPELVRTLGARAREYAVTRYDQRLVDQRLLQEITRAAQTLEY